MQLTDERHDAGGEQPPCNAQQLGVVRQAGHAAHMGCICTTTYVSSSRVACPGGRLPT
jgi:hypothetical protein